MIDMKRSKLTIALLGITLLGSTSCVLALGEGDVLRYGEGSKVSIEAVPGFAVDVPIKGNRGIAIGAMQGGKSIDGPFYLFGQKTYHLTTEPVTAISATELDFSGWRLAWGDNVIDLGGGVASVVCESVCGSGESYVLNYSALLPVDAGALAGLPYRLELVGTIK
jgi:hypothetical protein